MPEQAKRPDGFYWVRFRDHITPPWVVAYCQNGVWVLPGNDSAYLDRELSEINETLLQYDADKKMPVFPGDATKELVDAAKILADKLPRSPDGLKHYFAREQLLAFRKALERFI